MDRATDLRDALKFVIDRITKDAAQSGEPLSPEQRHLLQYLPRSGRTGLATSYPGGPTPVPRNLDYERLCALTKSAYQEDLQQNGQPLGWEFASAFFRVHKNPMWSLLFYAGVKNHRPWWDGFLLIFAALIWIALTLPIMFVVDIYTEKWTTMKWAIVILAVAPVTVLLGWLARRIERRQLDKEIERCRVGFQLESRTVSQAEVPSAQTIAEKNYGFSVKWIAMLVSTSMGSPLSSVGE